MSAAIAVIGSSNIDLIMKMARLPRVGETAGGATFLQAFGGKGANQAMAAAKAGAQVFFINCVGDDVHGQAIRQNLLAAGINVEGVFTAGEASSGAALIMAGESGRNYIAVAPGANYELAEQHIDRARPLIAQAELVMLQFEIPPQTLYYAIDTARSLGKKVMFNLAPALPFDESYLAKIDILVVNENEAEALCGFPVNESAAAQYAARALLQRGPHTVILTLGEQGALAAQGDELHWVSAFWVEAVDTTAAGDIFCGSLAAALMEGWALPEGVRFASAAAAISVTRLGAQSSIPTRQEIERFMKRGDS